VPHHEQARKRLAPAEGVPWAEVFWTATFAVTVPAVFAQFSPRSPKTPETAGERFGLWVGLLELERARVAATEMPQTTAMEP